jgi:hypothetical protein
MKYGRIVRLDDRDAKYPIRELLGHVARLRSYTWACKVVLDQGNVGACTGFSVAAEGAARPVVIAGVTNRTGMELYKRARQLDDIPGEDYEGSTVRGAMKAAVERGWYSEYRWAESVQDVAAAIGYHGPVVLGINWYAGMEEPDGKGVIRPTGHLRGGHAILCNGFSNKTALFRLHNSWGDEWGIGGACYISWDDLEMLLRRDGEACVPVKRLKPALGKAVRA